jgi:hypothetical protein
MAPVYALTVYNDELIAGGDFTTVGGVSASRIARWNGTTWQPLGSGMSINYPYVTAYVYALTLYNDELIAGGQFNAGGSASDIARWNGASWQALDGGIPPHGMCPCDGSFVLCGTVFALTEYNDELAAGGFFTGAGGMSANHIAAWDGTSWQALGTGMAGHCPQVSALTVYNGELIAGGGLFDSAGGVSTGSIARWDGTNWHPLGTGIDFGGGVFALTVYNGELIAAGIFTAAGGVIVNNIARWDGTSWHPLGTGTNGVVRALTLYNGELIAGGDFTSAGGVGANHIASWDAMSWQPLGTGTNGVAEALAEYNGELMAGGSFSTAGGNVSVYWARWSCPSVNLDSANPPAVNPYGPGVFRDVLQNTTVALVPQGIGVAGTPDEGPYTYAAINVTFSGTPSPVPSVANVVRACTDIVGNGPGDCPDVTSVNGSGAGPYMITLGAPPPPSECITFTFAGTSAGQKLQYQVLPGDTNLDGNISTQDLLWLVQRLNDGAGNLPDNRARYNINRSNEAGGNVVDTQDLLRLLQLLNGTNATQAFNGATVAACP